MSRAFENDPRLKHMDPGKLSALQSLAKELEAAPGDQKMAAFLSGLGGKEIALFGTAGFGKEDAYFEAILGRVKEHLPSDCRYLGGFMCPGKMGMGIRRRYEAMLEANPEDSRAKMLLENFDAVLDRPNDQDLEALTTWARSL